MPTPDEPNGNESTKTTPSQTASRGAAELERLRAARSGLIEVLANLMIEHWRREHRPGADDSPKEPRP